jgi:LmbE family N-acetylglucosaminyl deacetylase
MSKLTLMAVFAHPDDEAFAVGGTLAKYAAQACDVYLVSATRGELGEIRDSDLATAANLPFVREQELRCACEVYGIHPPRFLDYVDGQLAIVHQGQAVGKLVRLIRELRPQVLLKNCGRRFCSRLGQMASMVTTTTSPPIAGQR